MASHARWARAFGKGEGSPVASPSGHSMSSGSEKRKRVHNVKVRVTPAEREELLAGANREGLTVSSFILNKTLGSALGRQVRRPPIERMLLAKFLAHLGRVSGQLDQLAGVLHAGRRPPPNDALQIIVDDLAQLRGAVMKALGHDR